jgi:VanZ family protein
MLRKGKTALPWLLVLAYMAAIFYLSCLEAPDVPLFGTWMPDYVNHGAAYFVLSFLVFVALQRTRRSSLRFTFVVTLGWWLVFGLGMEFAQKYLTDTRQFSLMDLLADGIGATLAFLVVLALSKSEGKGKQLYAFLTGNR